jgi:hypothetical protein
MDCSAELRCYFGNKHHATIWHHQNNIGREWQQDKRFRIFKAWIKTYAYVKLAPVGLGTNISKVDFIDINSKLIIR